mmetsp:Transcript_22556/g.62653  ORF Transcript_22556/g.62653 Transcript_22556/m.62653 type:complete len:186 (+) Transcript_22556:165-722(+)
MGCCGRLAPQTWHWLFASWFMQVHWSHCQPEMGLQNGLQRSLARRLIRPLAVLTERWKGQQAPGSRGKFQCFKTQSTDSAALRALVGGNWLISPSEVTPPCWLLQRLPTTERPVALELLGAELAADDMGPRGSTRLGRGGLALEAHFWQVNPPSRSQVIMVSVVLSACSGFLSAAAAAGRAVARS